MATEIRFRGWQRPAVGGLVDGVENGRPRVRTSVEMRGLDAAGDELDTQLVRLVALLAGPGDVAELRPGVISGRYPAPGTPDAETTMCPYVEIADPGLPWRYTPRATPAPSTVRLRPWLSLVVGTEDEIVVAGDQVTIVAAVLRDHPLDEAAAVAHVQETGGQSLARLLSRRRLEDSTGYVAALVPTFVVEEGQLVNAWPSDAQLPVTLRAFAVWRFHTGPGGDFRTLAARLRPGDADASTGLATVRYPRRPGEPPLRIGGALTAVRAAAEPLPGNIHTDLRRLRTRPADGAGRPVIGLPRYGEAWHPDATTTTWGIALNEDFRHRGIAGLGLRLAVEAQEELAELAARHAGELPIADERVRHLALGEAAAGALWRRRLPADPARRVWLFGPALRRLMTTDGPVAERATAADRPMAAGWFSPATRRVLRPGPARTALAQASAADPGPLSRAANREPPEVPFAEAGLPAFDDIGAPDFEERRAAVARREVAAADRSIAAAIGGLNMNRFPRHAARLAGVQGRAVERAEAGQPLPWVPLALLLSAVGEGEDDPVFDEGSAEPLIRTLADAFEEDEPEVVPGLLRDLGGRREAPPPSRPVDLDRMAADLAAAFDPRAVDAPARTRVLGTISGLDPDRPLAPPEPCPALGIPVWRRLSRMAPDWLLPGVGQLRADTVIAVGTNPAFVDAFLAGLNTRLLEELRWRNLRVAAGCTPVRTFWFRTDPATGDKADDVIGIQRWDAGSELGAAQHRPGGVDGSDLVLVFRGGLFHRYPATLLYLLSARHGGVVDFSRPPAEGARRTLPTFQGRIDAETTFFGFVGVDPEEAEAIWVVLEEPPEGFRFRNDVEDVPEALDGASFADLAFDDPVRVLIQGDTLVPRRSS